MCTLNYPVLQALAHPPGEGKALQILVAVGTRRGADHCCRDSRCELQALLVGKCLGAVEDGEARGQGWEACFASHTAAETTCALAGCSVMVAAASRGREAGVKPPSLQLAPWLTLVISLSRVPLTKQFCICSTI